MDRPGAQPEAESLISTSDGEPEADAGLHAIRSDLKRDDEASGGAMLLYTMQITLHPRFRRTTWFLSLPDPRNVREAMTAHDANVWKEAMDKKRANLKSYNEHELVPQVKDLHTLKPGWACAGRSKTEFLTRTRPDQPPGINTNA